LEYESSFNRQREHFLNQWIVSHYVWSDNNSAVPSDRARPDNRDFGTDQLQRPSLVFYSVEAPEQRPGQIQIFHDETQSRLRRLLCTTPA
jgi:hypothetical protein